VVSGPRTVLVCDDDAVARGVEARMLTDAGYQVVGEVSLAFEAVELSRLLNPDAIVLDVSTSGMSGLAVLSDLRLAAPSSVIVVCSAFEMSKTAAMEAGAGAVLDKSELRRLPEIVGDLLAPLTSPASPD
jgi:CheY-like chemotaxis protein